MMERAKLLIMTVALTLLIWAAADSLVNESAIVGLNFEAVSQGADNLLVRLDPPGKTFELQIAGPRRAIEAVQAASPLKIKLNISDRPVGRASIPAERDVIKQQLVDQSPDFRRLTVVSVQPPEVPVLVDRVLDKEIEVSANKLTLVYDEKPSIVPKSVMLRIRESRVNELTTTGQWQILDISAELERVIKEKPTGQLTSVSVPLDPRQFGPDAELTPKSVEVVASLQAAQTIAEIPAVPVRLSVGFGSLKKAIRAVTADGTPLSLVTQTITVSGPTEEVGKLLRGDIRAYGIVQLKEADLEELGVLRSVIPEFSLPRGVELAKSPEPIEFKLIDATQNQPASGG